MDVPSRSDTNPSNLRVRRWNKVILSKVNGLFLYLINMNVIGKLLDAFFTFVVSCIIIHKIE
jgi:hypothetical protein